MVLGSASVSILDEGGGTDVAMVGVWAGGVCFGGGVRGEVAEAGIGGVDIDGIGSEAAFVSFVAVSCDKFCIRSGDIESLLGLV